MVDIPDQPHYRLAVRTLTEFVCRRGDIHFRYDAATQGREGIDAQQKVQRGRGTSTTSARSSWNITCERTASTWCLAVVPTAQT